MKAIYFALATLLFPQPAHTADLIVRAVGNDGGFRIGSECSFGSQQLICPIDTGSPFSVVALADWNRDLPNSGRDDLGSIGLSIQCEKIRVTNFKMLSLQVPEIEFHRCESFGSLPSLIGLNFFSGQTITFRFRDSKVELGANYSGKTSRFVEDVSEMLIVPGAVGTELISIAIDTGAPVTLVDQDFIDRHPDVFVESTKPVTDMMRRRGFRRYEMHAPFIINGIQIAAEFVYSTAVGEFSKGKYLALLGMNHLMGANWYFNLPAKSWAAF